MLYGQFLWNIANTVFTCRCLVYGEKNYFVIQVSLLATDKI